MPTVRDRAKRSGSSTPTLIERAATGPTTRYGHQPTTDSASCWKTCRSTLCIVRNTRTSLGVRPTWPQSSCENTGCAVLDKLADPALRIPRGRPSQPSDPYALSVPRMWFSRSISLRLRSFLLASSERIFCISMSDIDGAVPAQPHHLRDAARIVAIRFVAHRR